MKKLGSVAFTVLISAGLIIFLIVSTSMEAVNGTPFVQKVFYQTRWFDCLMALLWINLFCSTVIRFPFRKDQLGFLITHVGILGILIGAMLSKYYGIDGRIMIFEGETGSRIEQSAYVLAAAYPNQEQETFALRKGTAQLLLTPERLNAAVAFCPLKPKKTGRAADGTPVIFSVTDILEHAVEKRQVIEGPPGAALNHAVAVKLKSRQLGLDLSAWLVEREPGNASSAEFLAGPVKLVLREQKKTLLPAPPVLRVMDKAGHDILKLDIGAGVPQMIPIPQTGFSIKNFVYYPYAEVAGHSKLANNPEGRMFNPAVEFDLADRKGHVTHQIKFGFFPEFEAMHARAGNNVKSFSTDLKIVFEAGKPEDYQDVFNGPQITFLYDDTGAWYFQVKSGDKVMTEGGLVAGRRVASGYMDLEFSMDPGLSHAKVSYDIAPSIGQQGPLAAAIRVNDGTAKDKYWVIENQLTPVTVAQHEVNFFLTHESTALPFSLALKHFRKVNYPGTQDAASFESDVVLSDASQGITLENTVSMNKPLVYQGYKIFQTSYADDPQHGKASIFTVARNPGIPWIYACSILACLGACIQFFGFKERVV